MPSQPLPSCDTCRHCPSTYPSKCTAPPNQDSNRPSDEAESTSDMNIGFSQGFLDQLDGNGMTLVLRPCQVHGRPGYVLEQVASDQETYALWAERVRAAASETLPPDLMNTFFNRLAELMRGFERRVRSQALEGKPRAEMSSLVQYHVQQPFEASEPNRVSRYERDPVI